MSALRESTVTRSYFSVGDRSTIAEVMLQLLHERDDALVRLESQKKKRASLSEQHRASSAGLLSSQVSRSSEGKADLASTPKKQPTVAMPLSSPQITATIVSDRGRAAVLNKIFKIGSQLSDGVYSAANHFVITLLRNNEHAFAGEFTLQVERREVLRLRLKKDPPVRMHKLDIFFRNHTVEVKHLNQAQKFDDVNAAVEYVASLLPDASTLRFSSLWLPCGYHSHDCS